MEMREISRCKCFGGQLIKYAHESQLVGCEMKFNIYLPPATVEGKSAVPLLFFLSGLTCTEDNFMQKAGALQSAAREQLAICCPDTSPRGLNIPGDSDNWDFGVGAGFYVDATEEPWSLNYKMYSYVTQELPALVAEHLSDAVDMKRVSISGHSMGGHGALTIFLKNPGKYRSVSAFAPICHPTKCAWGRKAFAGYLGASDAGKWSQYDATELVTSFRLPPTSGDPVEILIDQGTEDVFHVRDGQLLPGEFIAKAKENVEAVRVNYREQSGYDHGYYFISTFIDDHIRHHAKALGTF